jgi:hypothetical protein
MIALLAYPALAQQGPTLEQYLTQNPWDARTSGPMLVVDPLIKPVNAEDGLSGYGRMETTVGGLAAIVPTTMVLLDDSFKEPPNLYDGLPRKSKILYLQSLLSADQWKTACSQGIGLGDLTPDQQAVFRSILPPTFTYTETALDENGHFDQSNGGPTQTTLTSQEEAGVKLHFFKSIMLGVRLVGGGSSGTVPQTWDEIPQGTKVRYRSDSAEDKETVYGIRIRQVVANKSKPSDLNYAGKNLNPPLSLPAKTSVADLCASLRTVTGLGIVPDVRLRRLTVETAGQSARSGDVLQALALGVSGAYRKVGSEYLLTYDREGIGTKRLRIECWKTELDYETRERAEAWKRAIGKAGGYRYTQYKPNSPFTANDAMTQFMAGDHNQGDSVMPASDLPAAWMSLLNASKVHFAPNSLRTDVAEPEEDVQWQFRLPDGRDLQAESGSTKMNELKYPTPEDRDYRSRSTVKPSQVPGGSSGLMVKTNDPDEVAPLVLVAKQHSFGELWLETSNPDVVKSAVGGDLPVRLVIKPWRKENGKDETLLDESYSASLKFRESETSFQESREWRGLGAVEFPNMTDPTDPSLGNIWSAYRSLASTPGLAGTVLCETEPSGYEPTVEDAEDAPIQQAFILDLGYTPPLRQKLIDSAGVDPVDIVDVRPRDLYQMHLALPYFGDPMGFGMGRADLNQPSGAFEAWLKIRSDANRDAITGFANSLPGPVLF